jgi:hypothetical protein
VNWSRYTPLVAYTLGGSVLDFFQFRWRTDSRLPKYGCRQGESMARTNRLIELSLTEFHLDEILNFRAHVSHFLLDFDRNVPFMPLRQWVCLVTRQARR